MCFYYKVLTTPPTLPKTMCLEIILFSLSLLGSPKLHHHDPKTTKIQNSNNNVP